VRIKDLLRQALWQDPDYPLRPVSCPELTFDGIEAPTHDKLLAQATSAGAKFDGQAAEIAGLTFDWNYDAASSTLHVTCTKKPLLVSCGYVAEQITKLIAKAKDNL
jgi:hypothetical protein